MICVYPTEKALDALPRIRSIIHEWNDYITEGFTDEEMEMFLSMMSRVAARAAELSAVSEEAYSDIDTDPADKLHPLGGEDGNK